METLYLMSKNAQTCVTTENSIGTMSRGDNEIPVRIERVTYHNSNTMTVRKWCLKSGMIVGIDFYDLPAPPKFAILVK